MSQQQIYDLLKNTRKEMTNKQISNILGIRISNVSKSTKRLSEWGDIQVREDKRKYRKVCLFSVHN